MNQTNEDIADDPRVLEAAREYLAVLEAGRTPNRDIYLSRHQDLAPALEECFDGIDLAHAVGGGLRPPSPPERTAEPLGDFQILRELGRGGMGVVYEAVQLSLGRRVALKVLPFAAGMDAKHLRRFQTEAHAAAQLHHTNIVPVYAVGCERGVHYYAMQLIDGRPLDVVISGLRGDNGIAGNKVGSTVEFRAASTTPPETPSVAPTISRTTKDRESFRSAALLAVRVAEALEYAHDAGVVHRDIKPANLLLDAKGTVWVTDFGLAHVAADVGMTQTGDVFGTLRYMSPEQAAGRRAEVSILTDVYSLGATLYELLTLEPIFPGQDRQTLLHQILHDDPRAPKAINRSIPDELETIVLKAVAKSPADRYATAGEMAADLRRFLDDRPILARRPTLVDRARMWARRHPAYVNAAAVVAGLTVVGLAASTALVVREMNRTAAALQGEKKRAAEAEQRFDLARRSADEMIRIADEELIDNPMERNLRRRLLDAALAYYQELIELRREDPEGQADLIETRSRVSLIVADLSLMQSAFRHGLLGEQSVQDDLKLTADQKKRVSVVLQDIGAYLRQDGGRARNEDRQANILNEIKAHESAIVRILTPGQNRRLSEIALQVRGCGVFRDPDVVSELHLTRDQRDQLRALDDGPPWGGPPWGGGPPRGPGEDSKGPGGPPPDQQGPPGGRFGDRRHGPPRRDSIAAMNKAVEILTPEQRARWREMTGAPFAGTIDNGRRPGGRPGRPG
ncbi:serine/threonine-protein kinase [Fimbriiglobus ruber]|uniref:non-specific serine/threonine protein kinase n=1 Tax=Fimbriiglobus ruber TaxID=1908690 RepID=A0A225CZI1_9BACT|nr:serine/threonine-protein kinase [Fimbriiglobus ruber]OWK34751.1 serine/threonine protein kinase [Fimbriiglobus ruber]